MAQGMVYPNAAVCLECGRNQENDGLFEWTAYEEFCMAIGVLFRNFQSLYDGLRNLENVGEEEEINLEVGRFTKYTHKVVKLMEHVFNAFLCTRACLSTHTDAVDSSRDAMKNILDIVPDDTDLGNLLSHMYHIHKYIEGAERNNLIMYMWKFEHRQHIMGNQEYCPACVLYPASPRDRTILDRDPMTLLMTDTINEELILYLPGRVVRVVISSDTESDSESESDY